MIRSWHYDNSQFSVPIFNWRELLHFRYWLKTMDGTTDTWTNGQMLNIPMSLPTSSAMKKNCELKLFIICSDSTFYPSGADLNILRELSHCADKFMIEIRIWTQKGHSIWYLAITGDLWSVFHECFREIWSWYKEVWLDIVPTYFTTLPLSGSVMCFLCVIWRLISQS